MAIAVVEQVAEGVVVWGRLEGVEVELEVEGVGRGRLVVKAAAQAIVEVDPLEVELHLEGIV